jgi:hypothetical protein
VPGKEPFPYHAPAVIKITFLQLWPHIWSGESFQIVVTTYIDCFSRPGFTNCFLLFISMGNSLILFNPLWPAGFLKNLLYRNILGVLLFCWNLTAANLCMKVYTKVFLLSIPLWCLEPLMSWTNLSSENIFVCFHFINGIEKKNYYCYINYSYYLIFDTLIEMFFICMIHKV